jgi:hypothetical protein
MFEVIKKDATDDDYPLKVYDGRYVKGGTLNYPNFLFLVFDLGMFGGWVWVDASDYIPYKGD